MIAHQEQLAPCSIEPTWKRRRVWWFTELQNGRWVEPGTVVEYREEVRLVSAQWMIGCFHYVTHYRGPQVLKG